MFSLCFWNKSDTHSPQPAWGRPLSSWENRFTGLAPGAFLLEEVVSCSDHSLRSQMSVWITPAPLRGEVWPHQINGHRGLCCPWRFRHMCPFSPLTVPPPSAGPTGWPRWSHHWFPTCVFPAGLPAGLSAIHLCPQRWAGRRKFRFSDAKGSVTVSLVGLLKVLCCFHWGDRSSVQFSHSVVFNSWWPHGLQHARLPCPSPTPGAYSNSCPLSRWCHPTISSFVVPFSSHLQSFLTSGSFPMSQFFSSGGQSIGVSASASVLPMNIQDWSHLGWTGWISLQSKGLSRVFPNTTVQKHQFFGAQILYCPTLTPIHDHWKNHSF